MASTSPIKLGFALAFVLVVQLSAANENKCRTGCRGGAQTFKYAQGTTYKYNLDSKIEISLSSAEGQTTSTELKAQVLLTQQPDCNQVLRLTNVQVLSADGKKHGAIPDIEKPIVLNNNDGVIEDQICIEKGDTQTSLNIKRAVASLFQASLKRSHETDVFGLCPTDTSSHKEGNVLVISKTRSLNKCAYRENVKQDYLATSFNLNSEIKSSPILNADFTSSQKVKNGILDQATVSEHYLYMPFSVGQNGAKTTVHTKLTFAGQSSDKPTTKCNVPRSIIFENPHPVNSPKSNVNSILNAVKETVKHYDKVVSENSAKEFINLIKILRVSNKDDLLAVYNQVRAGAGFNDKAAAKKIFLDALLRSVSGDTIEVAVELLKNKELNELEQQHVFIGLSFARHVSEAAINSASSLINQQKLPREAYLGIGSLVGRYCREHSCENNEAVNKIGQKLAEKLDGKVGNHEQENEKIYILKSLANIHHLTDPVVQKIIHIAQDVKNSNRLRAAALESYLGDACQDKLRDNALSILKNTQLDSEIRIRAYLVLAQCPNAKIGNAVKALLDKEPSYQVGGFIVSHIKNIRASANPDKELAKKHLGFFNVPRKFPVDPRKYSFNGELSYAFDTIGVGNSIESNIIFSQNSFLPRSINVNLTSEIFGHTFNFLDVQIRQENLEKLIEHYLGPKGLVRTKSPQDIYNTDVKKVQEVFSTLRDRVDKSLRARRDVTKAEIDHIASQVQIKANELNNDLEYDVSLKSFGSELVFLNYKDDIQKFTPEAIVDKIVNGINKGLDDLKNFDETLRSNILWLDAELAYPTSSGFPLKLAVEGSSAVQVKATGNIDVRALLKPTQTLAKLKLIPSANIEVSGRLTIDAHVFENGLKVASTLYTATGGDLIAEVFANANGIDVKYALPVQKQKIISATHNIVFHTRELGAPEVNQPLKFAQNKDFSICVNQLSPMIGLTFCGEFNGPNLSGKQVPVLPFPLNGDAKLAVTIDNDDVSLYHYSFKVHNEANKLGTTMDLETIGKNNNKKLSLNVETQIRPETFIKATLSSAVKKASLEGRIVSDNKEKAILLRLSHDNSEYYGKAGFSVSGGGTKYVYTPILEYRLPGQQGSQKPAYHVEGKIIVDRSKGIKYTFDNVKLVAPNQPPITINGNFGVDGPSFFDDITISNGQASGSMKGLLYLGGNNFKLNVELQNNVNPQANINLKSDLKLADGSYGFNLQLIHGKDLSSKTNMLTANVEGVYKVKSPTEFDIAFKNKLTYPLLGIRSEIEFEHKPKSLDYEVDLQYNDVKVGSELDLSYNKAAEGDHDLEFVAWVLENRLELKSKRLVKGDDNLIDGSLVINGKKFEVKGKVVHIIRPQNVKLGTDIELKIPTHNTPFKVDSGLIINPTDLDAHIKVSSSSTAFIDGFIKANKGGNANGNLKVDLKNLLEVKGDIKANKGSGNANLLIDIKTIKKSSKLESTFTIAEPTYNVVVTLYPVFNEDPKKKIVVSTHNKITPENIDSSNLIDILGQKLEWNIKGSKHGTWESGKINSEVDVTLPNQHYIVGKINRDRKESQGIINGQMLLSLEDRKNKNSPGRKISLKGVAKNTNPRENIYDLEYNIAADDSNGHNINADFVIKRVLQGDKYTIELKEKIHGSVLKNPIENTITSHYKNHAGSYEVHSNWGPSAVGSIKGNYNLAGEGKPVSGDIHVDITTPSKYLRSIKVAGSGSAQKPQTPNDPLILKGSGSLFVDDDGTNKDATVNLKGEGSVNVGPKEGTIHGSLNYGKPETISTNLGYSRPDEKQLRGHAAVKYGANKQIKTEVSLNKPNTNEYKTEVKLELPTEQHKVNVLTVHTKKSQDSKHIQSEVTLTSDGKKWLLNNDLVLSETTPSIDVKLTNPEGKLHELFAKISKMSEKHFAGELKVVHQPKNFLLEGSVDSNIENVDDFVIKATVNSPALNLNKIVFEAHNKPDKSGRRINVQAKSGNKNILSGSSTYTAREEHGKIIVEGSGSFKVKEESKSANFKYIRQNLSIEKNGETGIEISFDAGLGNQAIDAELKITNKQFRVLNSYCEEKKQCAHIEIDAKTLVDDINNFNQEIEVAVDLRKLGLSHEFGLKAVTIRKEYVLDHTVDVHFQSQENNKYQYSIYLHPKEAGVSLTTPKRIVALEAKIDLPHSSLKEGGKATGEVALYLNKKQQPNQKTAITGWIDVNPKTFTVKGEAKLTNPALQRPLSVKVDGLIKDGPTKLVDYDIELDVFNNVNQKVVISQKTSFAGDKNSIDIKSIFEIKSQGLNIHIKELEDFNVDRNAFKLNYKYGLSYQGATAKFDSGFETSASPQEATLLLRVLNADLLKVNSKLDIKKEQQIVNTEIDSYGCKTLTSHLEVKNWNSLKYTIGRKETPNDKLQLSSALIPGQIADARAELFKGGARQDLFHGTVKLDEPNFLKSDYNIDSKNIQSLLHTVKDKMADHIKELQKLIKQWEASSQKELQALQKTAHTAAPKLKPLMEYYLTEAKKIKEEILSDKKIRDVVEFLQNLFGVMVHTVSELLAKLAEPVEVIAKTIESIFGKAWKSFEREILPKLREIAEQILKAAEQSFEALSEGVLAILARAGKILESYQPQLKQIAAVLGEMTEEFGRIAIKIYQQLRELVSLQWNKIYSEIKASPAYAQLEAAYKDFIEHGIPSSQAIINTFKDAATTLRDAAPTQELKDLITVTADYIEKKLKGQPVDDFAAIDKIIKTATLAIRKILTSVVNPESPNWQSVEIPTIGHIITKLPKLAAVHLSPVSYLVKNEVVGVGEFLLSFLNNPRYWVPPFPLHAVIVQGQHIFTFDGKHITFPGKCNYLLARDAVNGNFTLAGTYANGLLTSITLSDKQNSVTYKKDGRTLYNTASTELPKRSPDLSLAVYREYKTVTLESTAGVRVICEDTLIACSIKVSGFYHGQLKGLLGNGNNEPYDDFTLPTGKIVAGEAEFGNAYKMSAGCPAIKTVDHHTHHPSPSCSKLFSEDSEMSICYPFVNPENYKMACEHGVAAGVKDTERAVAMGYVTACLIRNVPIHLPTQFLQCTNSDKTFNLGETFSAKTPGKAADIVVLVETIKENEPVYKELLQPVVQQLTNDLHGKGVSDVQVHVIAFGGQSNLWPSHVTVGGKITIKNGKLPALTFTEPKEEKPLTTECPKFNQFLHILQEISYDVKLAFGLHLQSQSLNSALNYPFRANAIKSIIASSGEPCKEGRLVMLQMLRNSLYKIDDVHLNVIIPFEDFTFKDSKHSKDVIGFNDRNVYTLSQAKKKPEGAPELKDVDYDGYCTDLIIENGGNVINADNFLNAKGAQRKQFAQVVAHNILDNLIGTEKGLDCECKIVNPYAARNICKVVHTKDKSNKNKA